MLSFSILILKKAKHFLISSKETLSINSLSIDKSVQRPSFHPGVKWILKIFHPPYSEKRSLPTAIVTAILKNIPSLLLCLEIATLLSGEAWNVAEACSLYFSNLIHFTFKSTTAFSFPYNLLFSFKNA